MLIACANTVEMQCFDSRVYPCNGVMRRSHKTNHSNHTALEGTLNIHDTTAKDSNSTILPSEDLLCDMFFELAASHVKLASPELGFRWHDRKTPSLVHPILAAMLILHEARLPERTRAVGAYVLTFHDILEDYHIGRQEFFARLSGWCLCANEVERHIQAMTFASFDHQAASFDPKTAEPETTLFTLYDKTSNLMDGTWMDAKLLSQYLEFTTKLRFAVWQHFGSKLNIVAISGAIIELRRGDLHTLLQTL